HWFHRNPLKATAPVSFNLYGVATNTAAAKICNYEICYEMNPIFEIILE
ncbi:hypothetical protein chiPu_0026049, partial [Chiloscyllium punctatum]|nr:hypothetical protein [Chiloscyllium punctatum]